ncbi:hypothetical protein M011DRAFT_398354 [Sporormia fimetaria CBS 119925]|uniref:Uncharacterized protein n=1 Tax=Sporormia fimetaria CBS 119925 TaxID=1340428 RepID=A0A6A6VJP8_9PLEO|nr:hypothetical protein M011DRAFT_398354 [Sporormia fimetaria CBS 119925]
MATAGKYIPSVALLRAISRPRPSRCPFTRNIPVQAVRGKRTATKRPEPKAPPNIRKLMKAIGKQFGEKDEGGTLGDEVGKGFIKEISWYEQDLDRGTPPVLVSSISTQEQVALERKKWEMLEEDARNPDYDDTELKKLMLDDLMHDPSFADLKGPLKAWRDRIEEEQKLIEAYEKGEIPGAKELVDSHMVTRMHEWAQDMLDNPGFAAARDELLEFQAKLPDVVNSEVGNGFDEAAARLDKKLREIPAVLRKVEELEKQEQDELDEEERLMTEKIGSGPDSGLQQESEHLDAVLRQTKELMAAMGGNKAIEDEIQALLDEDPLANVEANGERGIEDKQGFDFNELIEQLAKLKSEPVEEEEDEPEELNDPKIAAMVDKMIADPLLLQKLAMVKKHVERKKTGEVDHPLAPDPETLDPSRLATYRDRLLLAEKDPEHIAGLRRLQVHLLPPFNVAPALKNLNEALKLSYLGASDDVRRILWRSYMKARTVPTLLQNLPDDVWDMLWYSQAVKWGSNQNRENHLRILLRDLRSVGRDGPPTSPESFAEE